MDVLSGAGSFGIPDPKITTVPDYTGSIKGAKTPGKLPTHYLPYEWSPHTKIDDASLTQWHEFMAHAERKVEKSMKTLKTAFNEKVAPNPDDISTPLEMKLREARLDADAYMNHNPSDEWHKLNEVPRWRPDGTLHPDDLAQFDEATGKAKGGSRLLFEPPAQSHMETLLYRVPAKTIGEQNWEGIDTAAKKITLATDYMTYNSSPKGRPDVEQSFKLLRSAQRDLQSSLRNAGAGTPGPSLKHLLTNLTPTEARMATIAGVAALSITAAVAVGALVHERD